MNSSPFSIDRRVLLLGCCVWLGWPSAVAAQGQSNPLPDCSKSFRLETNGTGVKEYDPETKTGRISGAVEFECDGTSIFAEEITWNERMVWARGDLTVTQPGLRVYADRMEMDRQTRLGTFYNAIGTARITDTPPEKDMFGALEPEVMFRAEKLERIGPRTYRLTNGWFSTCVQATPRWDMRGSSGTITLDDHAVMRNVLFRVKGVPVLYVPYLYYPLKKEDRSTGFLIPTYSSSGVRGHGVSNAFFGALNRSQDVTLYHDYYSKTGQGAGAEYRYVAAQGSQGNARVYALFEKARIALDGTVERAEHRSYDMRGSINQALGRRFHLIGRANYFSDITTQQLYQQNVYDLSNRNRYMGVTLTGNVSRLRLTALVERSEIFSGTASAMQSSTPKVSFWLADAAIGRSRIYYGASGEVARVETRPFGSTQPSQAARRFDANGTVRAPLSSLPFLSFTTAASWRLTHWLESLDPLTGLPVPEPITRSLFDLRADMSGPTLTRVFRTPDNGYAEAFRHEIVPRVGVQWLSPFDRVREIIVTNPQVDGLVGGTTSVNYSLSNVIRAKVRAEGGSRTREILSVGVGQTYYSNALAGAVDSQYPSGAVGTFSPVQVTATVTPTNEVSGRFQMYIHPTERAVQSLAASTRLSFVRFQLEGGWSKQQFIPNVPGFNNPNFASHFLNATATFRTQDNRLGGTYGFNFDIGNSRFMQQRFVAYYNAQCCGISFDYQTINVSQFQLSGVPADRRFGVSFTLAGIGSFSSPLGGFGR